MGDCGKCTGNCCDNFTMKYSPREMQAMVDEKSKGKTSYIGDDGKQRCIINDPDLEKINSMLIFKRLTATNPQTGKRIRFTPNQLKRWNDGDWRLKDWAERNWHQVSESGLCRMYVYTCKHWNKETKLCNDYENRPDMCRNFGVVNQCDYKGCTLKKEEPIKTGELAKDVDLKTALGGLVEPETACQVKQ